MKWQVSIRAQARTDLRAASDWYEARCPGLGDEFLIAIAEVLVRLEQSPEAFPFCHRDFHRALTRRFPYKVFFQIHGNRVIIFRVLHGAQKHERRLRE